ncbi:MAG: hypothetical protein K9M80_09255 [Candidatus Marinimicrobia bacterium]|nr:hypothetical protein [Candidatus Neomarinimicrobiota bacterium]
MFFGEKLNFYILLGFVTSTYGAQAQNNHLHLAMLIVVLFLTGPNEKEKYLFIRKSAEPY